MSRRVFGTLGRWVMLGEGGAERRDTRRCRAALPRPDEMQAGAAALREGAGDARRPQDPDDPCLLRASPASVSLRGERSRPVQGARRIRRRRRLIAAARAEVMNEAASEPESRLGQAMRHLAERASDKQVGQALDAVIRKRDEIQPLDGCLDRGRRNRHDRRCASRSKKKRLNLADDETEELDLQRRSAPSRSGAVTNVPRSPKLCTARTTRPTATPVAHCARSQRQEALLLRRTPASRFFLNTDNSGGWKPGARRAVSVLPSSRAAMA